MDILSCLQDQAQWQQFYKYKMENGYLSKRDAAALADFIQNQKYQAAVEKVLHGEPFSPPRRVSISKMHSDKKRIVYVHPRDEGYVLKYITYLLQRKYDHLFSPNLYSFRPGTGVRNAIHDLTKIPNLSDLWVYKVDIRNYFNSTPVSVLLPKLEQALLDEPQLFRFLSALLLDPYVNSDGNIVEDHEKGIMAGTPISTFLANLYLRDLDWTFQNAERRYARYSDDIIVFAPTKAQLEQDIAQIRTALTNAGLSVNPAKELLTAPGEPWVFLGLSYHDGILDVAPVSIEKLKGKMRRKTRALMRWKDRKGATGINAAKAFIRVFNKKLFENPIDHELTWTRWYFPLITTTESLRVIDQYSQSCIRYLATGKHTKAAYNFRYEDMKELGYISLVASYYNHTWDPISSKKSEETVD